MAISRHTFGTFGRRAGNLSKPVLGWRTPFARHVGYPGFTSEGVVLIADGATYLLSGNSANLLYNKLISASSSSFILNGQDAVLKSDRYFTCSYAQYNLTGNNANLNASRILGANNTSFTLSGQDAAFFKAFNLSSESGQIVFTGQDAALKKNSLLTANSSSFILSGQNVTFFKGFISFLEHLFLII